MPASYGKRDFTFEPGYDISWDEETRRKSGERVPTGWVVNGNVPGIIFFSLLFLALLLCSFVFFLLVVAHAAKFKGWIGVIGMLR